MQHSKKVEDGKLVKIDAEIGEKFSKVKIHGDFFVEPADKLEEIRSTIEGKTIDFERERLIEEIGSIDADLIGFSAEDIVDVLERFIGEEK